MLGLLVRVGAVEEEGEEEQVLVEEQARAEVAVVEVAEEAAVVVAGNGDDLAFVSSYEMNEMLAGYLKFGLHSHITSHCHDFLGYLSSAGNAKRICHYHIHVSATLRFFLRAGASEEASSPTTKSRSVQNDTQCVTLRCTICFRILVVKRPRCMIERMPY